MNTDCNKPYDFFHRGEETVTDTCRRIWSDWTSSLVFPRTVLFKLMHDMNCKMEMGPGSTYLFTAPKDHLFKTEWAKVDDGSIKIIDISIFRI